MRMKIYHAPANDDPIDQGDILDGCLVLSVREFDLDGHPPCLVDIAASRVLVLTQTCDLANAKANTITVTSVFDAQLLVDQGLLKPADIRGPIRGGRVYGWYFLPSYREAGVPEMIVDLRQLHT